MVGTLAQAARTSMAEYKAKHPVITLLNIMTVLPIATTVNITAVLIIGRGTATVPSRRIS